MSTYQPPASEPRRGHCPCCEDARARLSQLREDAFDRAELELTRAHLDVARRERDALRERVSLVVRERDALRSQLDQALADVARLTAALEAA